MALRDRIRARVDALLGTSAYQPPKGYGPELDAKVVEAVREAIGGQIQPLPITRLRWYLADLERAQHAADAGNLAPAAQLWRAMRRDGSLLGLMGTRTLGMVGLPKSYFGNATIADELRANNGSRSVFDEMFPPSELAALDADGVALGIGVAELVPVPGRSYPVMVRLDPEFLQYRWVENRWYFVSAAGLLPITPGDGRWILHVAGPRMAPWTWGLWPALGQAWIDKQHAMFHRSNYSGKLANPARAAVAPPGATEIQRKNWISKVIAWGVNTVFEMPVGWDVRLIESNGRGFDVFQRQIDTSDHEFMIGICGQEVTTTGGAGFSNMDVQKAIRRDLLRFDADALAFTINTQGLPQYIVDHYGIEALDEPTIMRWDTEEPKDKAAWASTTATTAGAIKAMGEALAPYRRRLAVGEILTRQDVPTVELEPGEEPPVVAEEPPGGEGTGEGGVDAA